MLLSNSSVNVLLLGLHTGLVSLLEFFTESCFHGARLFGVGELKTMKDEVVFMAGNKKKNFRSVVQRNTVGDIDQGDTIIHRAFKLRIIGKVAFKMTAEGRRSRLLKVDIQEEMVVPLEG